MATRKPPPDDAEQSAEFLRTAKEVEVEKDGRAFLRAFDVVAPPISGQSKLTSESKAPKIRKPKAAKKSSGGISDG